MQDFRITIFDKYSLLIQSYRLDSRKCPKNFTNQYSSAPSTSGSEHIYEPITLCSEHCIDKYSDPS